MTARATLAALSQILEFCATFRALRDVTLDFRAPEDGQATPFVALVGANGAGKTSVLEGMVQLLREAGTRRWAGVDWQASGGFLTYTYDQRRGASHHITLVIPGDIESLAALGRRTLYVPSGYLPRLRHQQPLQPGPSASLAVEAALSTQESTWRERADAVHQWWLHMHWEFPRTSTLDRLWNALAPFLGELRYAGVNPQDHLPRFQIDDVTVTFNELSSGQRRIVLLFMEIAMHCGTDGLLLFDEPEAHFHPGWQRMLPEALGQLLPDGQVFVATHSPFVVEGLAAHQVFLLGDEPW